MLLGGNHDFFSHSVQTTQVSKLPLSTNNAAAGLGRDLDAAQLAVLDRPQRTRLEQIRLQANGPHEFKKPEFQRRMNLSADQIDELNSSANGFVEERRRSDETSEAVAKFFVADPENPRRRTVLPGKEAEVKAEYEKLDKDLKNFRQSVEQSIIKMLTKRQRENYRKMLGEPFDLNKLTRNPVPLSSKKQDGDPK